jgi:hypothetical protein
MPIGGCKVSSRDSEKHKAKLVDEIIMLLYL